jgi:hypothetical protein
MIEHAHSHTMIRVNHNKRRDCWECQIRERPPRPRKNADPIRRPSLQEIINKEAKDWAKRVTAICLQCGAPLCVHGEC